MGCSEVDGRGREVVEDTEFGLVVYILEGEGDGGAGWSLVGEGRAGEDVG